MTIRVYSTLTRTKEPLQTIEPGTVTMYVCGPTVYASAHIGHALSYVVFDTVRRYLEHRGYTVRFVQNFTDVDDKVIAKSNEEGLSYYEVADRYAREFLLELHRLGIKPAATYPRVSSEMPAIVATIEQLVAQGNAYAAPNGDVYFDVASFAEYGRLSRRPADEAVSGEEHSEHKRDAADFTLWKAAKPGEPSWESPWGRGRPGWHIECSVMCSRHLGEQIDIHGGGTDLIFPHHENEIAQSEAACQCAPFARYWMHNGLLMLGDEKMSKSLGNIVPIGSFLDRHEPDAFRLFVLSSHYRRPTTLSDESIASAEAGLSRLRRALRPARAGIGSAGPGAHEALASAAREASDDFHAAMDDDFGTPGALAALFDLVTAINTAREAGASADGIQSAQQELVALAGVLGLRLGGEAAATGAVEATRFVELLVALRNEARDDRNWGLADRIRDGLAALGVALEDTAIGTEWRMTDDDSS